MREEFSRYDKVVYNGEIFEVLETAGDTGMMKIGSLLDAAYEFMWVDEEMVVPLHRAVKLGLIDEEAAMNALNAYKVNDCEVEEGPFIGKDGSGKDDRADGKLRWDLLPLEQIEEIVRVYTEGSKKYADNSWQNIPDAYQRYKAAMLRHLVEYEKGNVIDKDTNCYHLAQVAWNAIAILYMDMHGKGVVRYEKVNDD